MDYFLLAKTQFSERNNSVSGSTEQTIVSFEQEYRVFVFLRPDPELLDFDRNKYMKMSHLQMRFDLPQFRLQTVNSNWPHSKNSLPWTIWK